MEPKREDVFNSLYNVAPYNMIRIVMQSAENIWKELTPPSYKKMTLNLLLTNAVGYKVNLPIHSLEKLFKDLERKVK